MWTNPVYRNVLTLLAATALSSGLAACGSEGGTTASEPLTPVQESKVGSINEEFDEVLMAAEREADRLLDARRGGR